MVRFLKTSILKVKFMGSFCNNSNKNAFLGKFWGFFFQLKRLFFHEGSFYLSQLCGSRKVVQKRQHWQDFRKDFLLHGKMEKPDQLPDLWIKASLNFLCLRVKMKLGLKVSQNSQFKFQNNFKEVEVSWLYFSTQKKESQKNVKRN